MWSLSNNRRELDPLNFILEAPHNERNVLVSRCAHYFIGIDFVTRVRIVEPFQRILQQSCRINAR